MHMGRGIELPDFLKQVVHLRAGFELHHLGFQLSPLGGDIFFEGVGHGSASALHDILVLLAGPNRRVRKIRSYYADAGESVPW
jgi:hypothetical protein